MKIRLVVVELSLADGRTNARTDVTKPKVAFRNFANAPKNEKSVFDFKKWAFWTEDNTNNRKFGDIRLCKLYKR
jgi:hypothetical protein